VFARDAAIALSPSAVLTIDAAAASITPDELVSAVLLHRSTAVERRHRHLRQATSEANAAVGDRANDALRIDASVLRVRVVAEGGNLGLTQAARVEFALNGGRIYTDAIDNSAGVDTSDHEVNIKILLGAAIRSGVLDAADRDPLDEMTDEVAASCWPTTRRRRTPWRSPRWKPSTCSVCTPGRWERPSTPACSIARGLLMPKRCRNVAMGRSHRA
jgi:glutamate dehydrogenase